MKNKDWTEQESKLLVEYYHQLSLRSILDLLPDRSISDITAQVALLKKKNKKFVYDKN